MADKKFLDRVYEVHGTDATRTLYDDWAETYDEEVLGAGYATPARVAEALAALPLDRAAPILDFGCGTGVSGVALAKQGFTTLDGCDLSQGMLEQARATGAYRRLWQSDPDEPLPFAPGDYAAIVAVGVISKGAAPPETFDPLLAGLAPGGYMAFSFNEHTYEDPRFEGRVDAAIERGEVRLLARQEGPHLPAIGLKSTVFVLERQ